MYADKQNSEGQITRVFFEIDNALQDWCHTPENVLLFDTKFGTNRYGLKLGLFCTVATSGQTIILAACLLQHEDEESFIWAFELVMDLLRKPPVAFFTDGDVSIEAAIKALSAPGACLHGVKHFLCIFHLFKNFYEKVHPSFRGDKDGWREAAKLFWSLAKETDVSSQGTFDEDFDTFESYVLTNMHVLENSEPRQKCVRFLTSLRSRKEKWAYRFCMASFTAGVHSTARAESKNAKVKRLLTASSLLTRVATQLVEDNTACRTAQETSDLLRLLQDVANLGVTPPMVAAVQANITPYAYALLCAQGVQAVYYNAQKVQDASAGSSTDGAAAACEDCDAQWLVRRVRAEANDSPELRIDNDGNAHFSYEDDHGLTDSMPERTTTTRTCSCQFPSCFGLPCRHMLRVYFQLNMNAVDMNTISSKWHVKNRAQVEMATSALRMLPKPSAQAYGRTSSGHHTTLSPEDRQTSFMHEVHALRDLSRKGDAICGFLRQRMRNVLSEAQAFMLAHAQAAPTPANSSGVYWTPPPAHGGAGIPVQIAVEAVPDNFHSTGFFPYATATPVPGPMPPSAQARRPRAQSTAAPARNTTQGPASATAAVGRSTTGAQPGRISPTGSANARVPAQVPAASARASAQPLAAASAREARSTSATSVADAADLQPTGAPPGSQRATTPLPTAARAQGVSAPPVAPTGAEEREDPAAPLQPDMQATHVRVSRASYAARSLLEQGDANAWHVRSHLKATLQRQFGNTLSSLTESYRNHLLLRMLRVGGFGGPQTLSLLPTTRLKQMVLEDTVAPEDGEQPTGTGEYTFPYQDNNATQPLGGSRNIVIDAQACEHGFSPAASATSAAASATGETRGVQRRPASNSWPGAKLDRKGPPTFPNPALSRNRTNNRKRPASGPMASPGGGRGKRKATTPGHGR